MAMEKNFVIKETHHKAVTVLSYHPLRREILAGFEDGHIKAWDSETYKLAIVTHEHEGWVTDFLFWQEGKVMLSSSNDGSIIAWSNNGGVADRIKLGAPVYVMALNLRRHQLVCGFNACIKVYSLDDNRESGHFIKLRHPFISREHTDIVKCITCLESRVYSAGYDQRLIIYDSSSYPGHRGISKVFCNPKAHEAGICCLSLVRDTDNNTWLITGSFDKVVKIWSVDGKLTHRLDGFLSTISDIVYVPNIKTVWIASGSPVASVYDPKSGENVSDFIGTFASEENQKYQLQYMTYVPELNSVIASTNRRTLLVWRYNPAGCVTALKCKHAVESLTYTRKVPILIFNGGSDGQSNKWERLQSNHFMYSKETFLHAEAKTKLSQLKTHAKQSYKPLHNKLFLRNPNAPNADQCREDRGDLTGVSNTCK
ncbi:Nuclear distribution protein nudF [Holothuria leucospilota]|uniref:Nuclear distribution protein nudF n=1 Tax=Holothuria leucospilota TaxID=206669 RepID=A0A9Q1BWR7_HOLLE|nr:Nuclear distribution protein nudF [Holothuria leucospilota]